MERNFLVYGISFREPGVPEVLVWAIKARSIFEARLRVQKEFERYQVLGINRIVEVDDAAQPV